jgi:hypothetical protein
MSDLNMQSEPITLVFTLSAEEQRDYVIALTKRVYHPKRKRSMARIILLTFGWISLGFAGVMFFRDADRQGFSTALRVALPFLTFVLGALFMGLGTWWWQKDVLLRTFEKSGGDIDYVVTIAGGTLTYESAVMLYRVQLSAVHDISEPKGGLLLRSGLYGLYIPARALEPAERHAEVKAVITAGLSPTTTIVP